MMKDLKSTEKREERDEMMSTYEFANLGEGEFAYITEISSEEAGRVFSALEDIPANIVLFALHSADGTPLALTDTLSAAQAQAFEEDLEIATVH